MTRGALASAVRCVGASLVLGCLVPIAAQSDPTAPECEADGATERSGPDWSVRVDVLEAFALLLPPSHDLARAGTQWYIHGSLDGDALVPDVAISLAVGVDVAEVVRRDFPEGAVATPVALGPATRGVRVTSQETAPDGTTYLTTAYLVAGERGTYRISRYEGFDWSSFGAVACSFHFVQVLRE